MRGKEITIATQDQFRPREGQIYGAENIRVGGRYIPSLLGKEYPPFTVLTKPDHRKNEPADTLWVTVVDQNGFSRKSLGDLGVAPYDCLNGKFINGTNRIEEFEPRSEADIWSEIIRAKKVDDPVVFRSALISGAAESRDEIKRLAYLMLFGNQLHEDKQTLDNCELTLTDILNIVNRSYQIPGTRAEKQAAHEIAMNALSLFSGLY